MVRRRTLGTSRNAEALEKKARRIVRGSVHPVDDTEPGGMLRRELALALEHLEASRDASESVRDDLLTQECRIRTDLSQLEDRTPRYAPVRFPEWEKLKRQLQSILAERRRTVLTLTARERELQQHLLGVLEKYLQLTWDDEA